MVKAIQVGETPTDHGKERRRKCCRLKEKSNYPRTRVNKPHPSSAKKTKRVGGQRKICSVSAFLSLIQLERKSTLNDAA